VRRSIPVIEDLVFISMTFFVVGANDPTEGAIAGVGQANFLVERMDETIVLAEIIELQINTVPVGHLALTIPVI